MSKFHLDLQARVLATALAEYNGRLLKFEAALAKATTPATPRTEKWESLGHMKHIYQVLAEVPALLIVKAVADNGWIDGELASRIDDGFIFALKKCGEIYFKTSESPDMVPLGYVWSIAQTIVDAHR